MEPRGASRETTDSRAAIENSADDDDRPADKKVSLWKTGNGRSFPLRNSEQRDIHTSAPLALSAGSNLGEFIFT